MPPEKRKAGSFDETPGLALFRLSQAGVPLAMISSVAPCRER